MDKKELLYAFMGDASSLVKASSEAVSALKDYDDIINKIKSSSKGTNSITTPLKEASAEAAKTAEILDRIAKQQIEHVANIWATERARQKEQEQRLAKEQTQRNKITQQQIEHIANIWAAEKAEIAAKKKANEEEQSRREKIAQQQLEHYADLRKAEEQLAAQKKQQEEDEKRRLETIQKQRLEHLANLRAAEQAENEKQKTNYPGKSFLSNFTGANSQIEGIVTRIRSMADGMSSLGTKVTSAGGAVSKLGPILTSVGSKLSAVAGPIGVVIAALGALVPLLTQIGSLVVQSLAKITQAMTPIVKGMAQFIAKVTELSAKVTGGTIFSPIISAFESIKNVIDAATSSLVQFTVGLATGAALAEATQNAIDMVEVSNLFNVAMKDNIATGNEFITTMSEMYGLDPTNLQEMTGLFYEMGAAVDVPVQTASDLALDMTKLSLNISSLFNVPIDQVSDNLISGVRGMSRAVIKYGMDLRATTVEAYANSIGITENFETMNEASRVLLRYLVMVEQASDANNDFAETIDSPANQLRILQEQILQLGRTIGRYIVQAFKDIIPVLNGIIMAVRLILEALADFLGIFTGESEREVSSSTDDIASGIGSVGDAAEDTTDKLQDMLAPFDELNILAKETSSNASGGVGGSGLTDDLIDPMILRELEKVNVKLDEIRTRMHDVRDAFLEFFGLEYKLKIDPDTGETISKLEIIPGQFADKFTQAMQKQEFQEAGYLLGNKLSSAFVYAYEYVSWENVGKQLTQKIEGVATFLNGFLEGFTWENLGLTLGATFETALRSFLVWLETFDYYEFGDAIARTLNGFIAEMDNGLVGEVLAEWLNSCVSLAAGLAENFDWVQFKDNMVESLEVFFKTFDFNEFLDTAELILNHLVDALEAVVQVPPWEDLGAGIADAMQRIPWADIIDTALFMLTQLVNAGIAIIANAPWATLGSKIAEWLTTIPWEDMLETSKTIINDLIDAIIQLKQAVDWSDVGVAIAEWLHDLKWAELLSAVVSAIVETLISGIMRSITLWADDFGGSYQSRVDPFYQSPNSDSSSKSSTKGFATGGVVTRPTSAIIGEGIYDEAVIPLGNSPQMESMLNRFADIVAGQQGGGEIVVKVYIGEKEWDAFTYESAQRGQRIVGRKPVREGT